MPVNRSSDLEVGLPMQEPSPSYSNLIIGAAVFDLNGLPKEYFALNENRDAGWVQTIFQAIGLQSLVMSSLKLEGFHHAIVHETSHRSIVIRQRNRYTALLLDQTRLDAISEAFIAWANEFDPSCLKANQNFTAI